MRRIIAFKYLIQIFEEGQVLMDKKTKRKGDNTWAFKIPMKYIQTFNLIQYFIEAIHLIDQFMYVSSSLRLSHISFVRDDQ